MRIYLAGLYAGGRGAMADASVHLRVTSQVKYPYLLESFHYITPRIVEGVRKAKDTLFLDSGAFSMFTQGVAVDLDAYARFIKDHQDIIHIASNLDAIGAGGEKTTYDRQKQLEKMGVKIQPVFHARDKDEWLKRYLDEGYDYIFLGGMVPESTGYLKEWLDRIWHQYLTNPDGTARVKIHGFGLTTLSLIFRYPWYSVDSTSWVMTSRYGAIYLDIPQPDGSFKDVKIDFSSKSSKRNQIGSWHFDTLSKPEQEAILARLEEMEADRPKIPELEKALEKEMGFKQGFNPKALGESYGWRDYANIEYFRRAMKRKIDHFKREQETLW